MMKTIKIFDVRIEHGVPVTLRKKWSQVFDQMKAGDSFIVETMDEVRSAHVCAKRKGITTCARKTKKGDYRVWRVN
jgi:hypothetical protein